MKINQYKFNRTLKRHKQMVSTLGKKLRENPEDQEILNLVCPIKKSGEELVLVSAEFKCEKTGRTDELQFHHLITKDSKKIMKFYKYITQRHYWANRVIITKDEHEHNTEGGLCIPQERIDAIKKEYMIGDIE